MQFKPLNRIVVWEAFDAADPMTQAAGDLYEKTLPVGRTHSLDLDREVRRESNQNQTRQGRRVDEAPAPGRAGEPHRRPDRAGRLRLRRTYPNYGGYLCYIGVADWARRMGVGTRLFDQFFRQMAVDAGELGAPLPFVIWESHRPKPGRPHSGLGLVGGADEALRPRRRAMDRGRGLPVAELRERRRRGDVEPVPLQLFVKPIAEPAGAFDAERLKQVVAGLHREVYHNGPGDELHDRTLPPDCQPRLRPAKLAGLAIKMVNGPASANRVPAG